MAGKNLAVFGIYPTYHTLEIAVGELRSSGFRNTDISFLMPENVGSKDLVHKKASKAPEGAVAGAGSGVVIGGAIGWLVGIGALTIPGLGQLLMAGPIVAALAGAGMAGTTGGIIGGLIGMGIPEYEAKRYEGRVRKGGILLSIHCDDSGWSRKAQQILSRTRAEDIGASQEATADFARTSKPIPRNSALDQDKLWRKRGV
jgi:hypothetical protein